MFRLTKIIYDCNFYYTIKELLKTLIYSHRDALLLVLNAFSNVRLKPLSNLTIDQVLSAEQADNMHTIIITGKHKTGINCKLSIPRETFKELHDFCLRLKRELKVSDNSHVGYVSKISYFYFYFLMATFYDFSLIRRYFFSFPPTKIFPPTCI